MTFGSFFAFVAGAPAGDAAVDVSADFEAQAPAPRASVMTRSAGKRRMGLSGWDVSKLIECVLAAALFLSRLLSLALEPPFLRRLRRRGCPPLLLHVERVAHE